MDLQSGYRLVVNEDQIFIILYLMIIDLLKWKRILIVFSGSVSICVLFRPILILLIDWHLGREKSFWISRAES